MIIQSSFSVPESGDWESLPKRKRNVDITTREKEVNNPVKTIWQKATSTFFFFFANIISFLSLKVTQMY